MLFLPRYPTAHLLDRRDVTLAGATNRSFWLNGSAWEHPDFDNAEAFAGRLARNGVIARARLAATFLRQGVSIGDTVHRAGYFDQAHLTRSLRHFIGQTPARILRGHEQLSFLYKTAGLP